MGKPLQQRAVGLGEVPPARSRHAGKRSAVTLSEELVVTGTATGDVVAHDRTTLDERWRAETETEMTSVVAAEPFVDGVAVGERSSDGTIRFYDGKTGELRWQYATATDLGAPQRSSRFFLPFVAAIETDGDRLYVAARRYERDGESRSFTSVVYALDETGDIVWTHDTDASPIGLDVEGHRLAVAYNRCPGTHQHGVVVLDPETGAVRYQWDPGTDGQRRVGDVSLVEDGVVVASHGDYCGYRLRDGGAEQWCVDLGTPAVVDDETVYAYPNHVHATANGAVFVTGNTYSTAGRETTSLHPREHTALGYAPDGECVWTASVGGFASELGVEGDRVAVPGAQHFRTRDAEVHGLRVFGTGTGPGATLETEGIVTAVALDAESFVAVEEPVVYHDEGERRGAYRLLLGAGHR
ncbi:PQQ-binding-like beta-propeller repeat protein [Haloarchaeobius sp. FL176]|uniref:outer membrane protein assembly factor BamB family protein n=1 Tax=Haloarchaeobius sp. FL176 TaxID=2967129 RepID=UPI002148DA8B|nr:PQQ-binding-like beta-propeller repeat protein [Haloarchaeobius sp. FL176]